MGATCAKGLPSMAFRMPFECASFDTKDMKGKWKEEVGRGTSD